MIGLRFQVIALPQTLLLETGMTDIDTRDAAFGETPLYCPAAYEYEGVVAPLARLLKVKTETVEIHASDNAELSPLCIFRRLLSLDF